MIGGRIEDGAMKRRGSNAPVQLLAVLVATVLALTVAGCSGGGSQSAGAKQTIRFSWWGDTDRLATTKKVLAAFQKQHPNITVQVETTGDTDSYFDKLATEMAANDAPDVMTLGGAYPREFSDRGALLDLSTVSAQPDLSKFPASTLAASKFNGKQYGVPTGGNAIGLIINPKIFQQAGVPLPDTASWTWEDFVRTAARITANSPKGTYGFEPRTVDTIGVYAQQRGSAVYNTQGKLGVSADTLADYWRMEQTLLKNKGIPSASQIQELVDASPEQTLMGQGKAAMTIGYSNLLGTYAQSSGDKLELATIPGAHEYRYAGPTILPSQPAVAVLRDPGEVRASPGRGRTDQLPRELTDCRQSDQGRPWHAVPDRRPEGDSPTARRVRQGECRLPGPGGQERHANRTDTAGRRLGAQRHHEQTRFGCALRAHDATSCRHGMPERVAGRAEPFVITHRDDRS